jgi:hypothetical protein
MKTFPKNVISLLLLLGVVMWQRAAPAVGWLVGAQMFRRSLGFPFQDNQQVW